MLSQLPTHHPQLATQPQQQYFPMSSAATTNGVPQAGPGINFNDSYKQAQDWGNKVKPVPPKTMQVADQPKHVQVQPMNTLYSIINIFIENLDYNI